MAALGKVGNQVAWTALASFSKVANPDLQTALTEATVRCADALAGSVDRKTATPIYAGLLAPSQPAYVRRAALNALLRMDKEHAQPRILEILHGTDSTLKPVAIANVRALPPGNASEVFAGELPRLQPQEQVWMIDSLAARGDVPAFTAIGGSLASADTTVRRAAINTLGRIGSTWCVALFVIALDQSKDNDERRALESALISLGGGAPTDSAVVAALQKSTGGTRASLVSALARRQGAAMRRRY